MCAGVWGIRVNETKTSPEKLALQHGEQTRNTGSRKRHMAIESGMNGVKGNNRVLRELVRGDPVSTRREGFCEERIVSCSLQAEEAAWTKARRGVQKTLSKWQLREERGGAEPAWGGPGTR